MTKRLVEWTDTLLTGDREIDTHHRALFLTVQRLEVACGLGRGEELIEATLRFLDEYGAKHFAAEGQRMIQLQYPYMETHRAAHRFFLNRIEELSQQLARGADKRAIANETAAFAHDWFTRHVKLVDMPLIEYLRGAR